MKSPLLPLIAILFLLSSTGCGILGSQTDNKTLILDYTDFGPQAAVYELIGRQWWQWQSHGDPRSRVYPIKVVVYRNMSLKRVKSQYPVDPYSETDYRYVSYLSALTYLNKTIADNLIPAVTERLRQTRKHIFAALGK